MKIVNQGRVDVEYVIHKQLPIVRDTKVSNRVTTYILEGRLFIKKEASKEAVGVLETYQYKIHIMNISMIPVHHIKLMDDVPANLHMVSNATKVNGKKTRGQCIREGIRIGTLNPRECCEIEFSAYALCAPRGVCVCNYAQVQYDYLYQIDKKPVKFLQDSNAVITKIENRLVRSMTIQATLCVPANGGCCGTIEQVDAKVIHSNTKVIHTKQGHFALAVGVMKYHLSLCYYGRIRNSFYFVEGFSTMIKVPDAVFFVPSISCNVDTKVCSFSKLDCHRVSVSTALILSIKGPCT